MEDTDVDSSVGPATEELKTAIETTTDAALSDASQDAPNNAAGSLQDSEHQQQDAIPELAADTGSPGAPEPPAALDGSPAELQGPAPAESSAGTSADSNSAAGDAAEAVANAASSPKPAKRPAVKLKAAKKPQEPIEAASSEPQAPPGDAVPAEAVEAAPAKLLLKPKPPVGKSAAAKAAAQSAAAAAPATETAGAKQDGEGEDIAATLEKPAAAKTAAAKAAAKSAAAKAAGGSAADAAEQPVGAAKPPAAGNNETSAAATAGPDGNKTAAEEPTAAAAAAKQPVAAKPTAAAAKPKPKPKPKPAAAEAARAQETAVDASEAAEPAAKSPATADAGPEAPDSAAQLGEEQATAAAPAAKPVASNKPAAAKKKPMQVAVAGDSKPSQLSAANSPIAAASTHGSNAARKGLHSLFGEASTLSVLSQEGSELPGSRPPAQLHAALDGHDHGQAAETEMNDEEQQEIQKIISEIHGNGNDSGEDESEDGRLAEIKHHHLMPAAAAAGVPGSNRNSVIGAMPSSLLGPQQQPADDLVRYEASGVSAGAVSPSTAVQDEELVDAASYSPQHAEEQQGRASPWPGVTQIQHELLQPDSSMEVTPAAHAAAAHSNQQHLAAGYSPRSYDEAAPSYTESAAYSEPVTNAEGSMVGGGYEGLEEGTAEEEERSRAIAEQLAQLHEESRRLQLQSQLLQHRAIEMSLQMAATGNAGAAEAAYSSPAAAPAHQPHHISAVGALPNLQPRPQPEQQGLITGTTSMNSTQGLGFGQALSPDGMPLNPDALGLGDGELPRHPPGDSTPSSVTSSRAGLNWNIPSRGSIPSPGKVDSYSPAPGSPYLTSADAPRSNFSTIAQGFALHADPSLDYQMYSYHNNSKPAVASNSSLSETEYSFQQDQQQQQQQRRQSLQQQQQQQQYPYQQQQQYQPPQQLQQQLPLPPQQQQWRQEAPVQPALPPIHHAPPPPPPPPAAHDLPASQHPAATVSHTSGRNFRSQKSISKSSSGQKAPPPLVVRKPTLPVKQGSGASTRVAAAGATAGRRSSIDNLGGSYYGLVNEPPVIGTFNAAHAVAGAHGTVVKAKQQQQQQQQQGTGRVSPRGSMAAVPAAAAVGSPKTAAGSVSAAAAAAAAAATSKLAGGSSSKSPTSSSSKGGSLSPAGSPTAAALAAAAAAAGSSGSYNHHPRPRQGPQATAAAAAPAGPWGAVPVNPYAAAAMYGGGYAPVNPALVPMMMMNSKMQAGGNPSSNKGVANKISPTRAGGQPGMMGPEALAAMAAAVPPGAAWMPMGLPPGFVPVMPQGAISAPGSKPSLGPKTHNQGSMGPPGGQNPMKAATGVLDASGKPRRGAGAVYSAPAGMQYGLPGMAPGAFMPMPGMPGPPYPPVGFNMPYGMGANPNPNAQQAGKHAAANPTAGPRGAKGSMQQAGYMNPMPGAGGYLNPMPPGGAYPAGAAGGWGPMMGPPGQFGMMPMYAAPPGAPSGTMPGFKQQQQGGKGGKAAGGKGGWQS